jgi:hypothetical protein
MPAAVFAAACATPEAGQAPDDFANATRHNIAVQLVNPESSATAAPQTLDGARAALGQARYIADRSERPREVSTSSAASGSQ